MPRDEDQIDPTDILNFDQVNMRMTKDSRKSEITPDSPIESNQLNIMSSQDQKTPAKDQVKENIIMMNDDNNAIQMAALLRQYVMMLVENLESQVGSAKPVPINLRLKVSKHDLYKLKEYGQRRRSDAHEIYEVLNHIIQYASKVEAEEFQLYWLEERSGLCFQNLLLCLALVFSAMLLLKMIKSTVFTRSFIWQTLIVMFCISVGFTWIEKYQEVLADQEQIMLQKYSNICKHSEDQSFMQRALSYIESQFSFKDDKCQEFHKARFVNPVIKVSPMEALAVAVVKTVVSPVGIVGSAISLFLTSVLKDLPVHWQFYVAGFMFVLVIFLVCVCSGYEVNSLIFSIGRSRRMDPQLISAQEKAELLQKYEQIMYRSRHIETDLTMSTAIDRPQVSAEINRRQVSAEINRRQVSAEINRCQVSAEINRRQICAEIHTAIPVDIDRPQVCAEEMKNSNHDFDQIEDISDTRKELDESNVSPDSHPQKPLDNEDKIVEGISEQLSQQEISSKLDLDTDKLTNCIQQLDISKNSSEANLVLATN
ncbi:hypothetical protein Btru_069467 [Bulinus truncatus]|nr:hypothetical protein Btru_069467 [Bulinus truncatus]